jgi:hypothetical protein
MAGFVEMVMARIVVEVVSVPDESTWVVVPVTGVVEPGTVVVMVATSTAEVHRTAAEVNSATAAAEVDSESAATHDLRRFFAIQDCFDRKIFDSYA